MGCGSSAKPRWSGPDCGQADEKDWLTNEFFFNAFTQVLRSHGGFGVTPSAEEIFEFRFNQDWREFRKDGVHEVLTRGGEQYCVPVGWKKFAVRASGKYDGGDDSWLGLDGNPGEWAVAYHGTKHNCLPGILLSGFQVGGRQVFADMDAVGGVKAGVGIYCSPNIDDVAAHENYATPATANGHSAQFVMQCRVRPGAIKKLFRAGNCGLRVPWDQIWVVNDPEDIRPYAVLVRGTCGEWAPNVEGVFTNAVQVEGVVFTSEADEPSQDGKVRKKVASDMTPKAQPCWPPSESW